MGDYDREHWENLWQKTLEERADQVSAKTPHGMVTSDLAGLNPGRALDAGCGHGAEALWLASQGWQVTAVDFSTSALEHGRAMAAEADLDDRVQWVEADLGHWTPEPDAFDLVISLYVHVDGSVEETVRRLAGGVLRGGSLVLVGHLPVDPETGEPSKAAGQRQVTVDAATTALDRSDWEFLVSEERPRSKGGADAVVWARRLD